MSEGGVLMMKKISLEKPRLEVFEEFIVDSRKVKVKLLSIDIKGRSK
jgi:hypothetical protein